MSKKLRLQKQEDSKKNRYKIVNCLRSQQPNLEKSEEASEVKGPEYTIYDIETESFDNKTDQSYVYDLYYTTSDYLGELDDYVR